MKRQISCFEKVVVPFVVAAAALWTSPRMAVAQTPGSFSVNFEKIRFEYSAREAVPTPFGLELTLDPAGRLEAAWTRISKSTDVTLKRGVIGPSPQGTQVRWEGRIESEVDGLRQIVGDFRVETTGGGASGDDEGLDNQTVEFELGEDDDQAEYEYDAAGRLMRVTVPTSAPGVFGVGIQFDAAPGQQLRGSPPDLFNAPRPGEPLIGRLPKPGRGQSIELDLKIEDADTSKGGTLIPVKIKHNA